MQIDGIIVVYFRFTMIVCVIYLYGLLYLMDETNSPVVTLKTMGYWSFKCCVSVLYVA